MIRDLIPPKARRVVYAVLGAAVAVNGIIGLVDATVANKAVAVAAALGFTLAAGNVAKADES